MSEESELARVVNELTIVRGVLGTLIGWLYMQLGEAATRQLLEELARAPKEQPK